jgi:hypothetical protein
VVVTVVVVEVVVTVPTHVLVSATHLSSMVAALPSSHCSPAQALAAEHTFGPGTPNGKQLLDGTMVVDAVDGVVVMRMPVQPVVKPTHLSSMVSGFPSSHTRPRQNVLTIHEATPGGAK